MPCELSVIQRLEQIRSRRKIERIEIIMKLYNIQVNLILTQKVYQVYQWKGVVFSSYRGETRSLEYAPTGVVNSRYD